MNWNKHYEFIGKHAFLSPSKHHWLGYDLDKLRSVYSSSLAQQRGIRLHELARALIEERVKLPKIKLAFNLFVNDAIGYRMSPEQILFYSYHCFGTADAISFRNRLLRIHDLKTGYGRVSMNQLEIYTALFCLEYEEKPTSIDVELRIYQSSGVIVHSPKPQNIKRIIEKIILFDRYINEFKEESDGFA